MIIIITRDIKKNNINIYINKLNLKKKKKKKRKLFIWETNMFIF